MSRRSIRQILDEWRAAEAEVPADGTAPSVELLQRLGYLRAEFERRSAELRDDAEELGRHPADGLSGTATHSAT